MPLGPGRDVLGPRDVHRNHDHPVDVGVAAVLRILADIGGIPRARPAPVQEA